MNSGQRHGLITLFPRLCVILLKNYQLHNSSRSVNCSMCSSIFKSIATTEYLICCDNSGVDVYSLIFCSCEVHRIIEICEPNKVCTTFMLSIPLINLTNKPTIVYYRFWNHALEDRLSIKNNVYFFFMLDLKKFT